MNENHAWAIFYAMKFEHEWIQDTLDSIDVNGTRLAYEKGLTSFWDWYKGQGEPKLTLNVGNRFKRFLQKKGYSTSTISVFISSLKLALDTNARPTDLADRLDLQDISQKLSIKRVKSDNYSVKLSIEERDKLFATCPPTLKGKRDLAVLTLIFYAGLRRGEIAKLNLDDFDPLHGMLFIREAKHHKDRAMPLHPLAISRINEWLAVRDTVATCEALFVSVQKQPKGNRFTGANIHKVMGFACINAGIPHYHPHDGRATYITMLHDNGVPIGDIQTLAGHSNSNTTLGYVRVDFNKLRQAVLTLR